MDVRSRLKNVVMGMLICILALPAAFFITMITFPFWRWLELVTGIESFGHSGPSEWCYWFVYGLLLTLTTYVWWRIRCQADN